jgi:hypothetical protein
MFNGPHSTRTGGDANGAQNMAVTLKPYAEWVPERQEQLEGDIRRLHESFARYPQCDFAATRQVVVFTHDAAFVADLKREAKGLGVPVCERSVLRGKGTEVASWTGHLSETWERVLNQEFVGQILPEGGTEVRTIMTKILVHFTAEDDREFQASYSRASQWAKRHEVS